MIEQCCLTYDDLSLLDCQSNIVIIAMTSVKYSSLTMLMLLLLLPWNRFTDVIVVPIKCDRCTRRSRASRSSST